MYNSIKSKKKNKIYVMKSLVQYIKESLINEAYSFEFMKKIDGELIKLCEEDPSFKKTPNINNVDEVLLMIFDKTSGKLLDTYNIPRSREELFNRTKGFWGSLKDVNAKSKYTKSWIGDMVRAYEEEGERPLHVNVITKTAGIQIILANPENANVVSKVVANNFDIFNDDEPKSTPLTEEEIEILTNWFEDNVKNLEIIKKKGTFAAYFPSKEDVRKSGERLGYNAMPHLTISRPPAMKGNLKITIYKKGNWAASEWPDIRRMMDNDGNPKYATVESIIENALETNFKKRWAERLGAELK